MPVGKTQHALYVLDVEASSQSMETLCRKRIVTWYVWRNDEANKLCKVLENGTTNDLTNLQRYIISILPQFLQHCYTKREQATAYQQKREAAESDIHDTSHALIQVDFSENYTCVAQDKIQSAHCKQHRVSLFTVAICQRLMQLCQWLVR